MFSGYDNYSVIYDSYVVNEESENRSVLVAFRRQRIYRLRTDHFARWRDDEFFDRFRLSKRTVTYIVDLIRDRISSHTDWNNVVSPEHKVLIALRYYASGSIMVVCGDFMGIHKSIAIRIVQHVSHYIAALGSTFICFPTVDSEIKKVQQEFYNIAKFPMVIGALDCTHIRIKTPGGDNAVAYRNRKGFYSMNVQIICDANLKIQDIVTKWTGSSHDSTIFNNSSIRRKFDRGEMNNCLLVADSGYTQHSYVMTRVGDPQAAVDTISGINIQGVYKYNKSLVRARNIVQKSYGIWKYRFPILATGIDGRVASPQTIIIATAVLHNIACHFGENVPRVSSEELSWINATDFNNISDITESNAVNSTKKKLLRYFQSKT